MFINEKIGYQVFLSLRNAKEPLRQTTFQDIQKAAASESFTCNSLFCLKQFYYAAVLYVTVTVASVAETLSIEISKLSVLPSLRIYSEYTLLNVSPACHKSF